MAEIWIAYAPHLNGGPKPEAFVAKSERKAKRLARNFWTDGKVSWAAMAKHGWRCVRVEGGGDE